MRRGQLGEAEVAMQEGCTAMDEALALMENAEVVAA